VTDAPVDGLDALAMLDARRSVPARQLRAPAPDDATLLRMLRSAARVPDHGKRVPFRFIRIHGDARARLGEAVARIGAARDPEAGEAARAKDLARFTHAPLVVVVVAILDRADTIPAAERLLTAGCSCFALLQAAQALGFGATWLTGWPAHDRAVAAELGLGADEQVAGFIHIGTAEARPPDRPRPDPEGLLTDWTGAA
jgi:nitroreductase